MSDEDRYGMVGSEEPTCPRCRSAMASEATVCGACGHARPARQTACDPVAKHWDPGLAPLWRVRIFLICQGLARATLVVAAFIGELVPAVVSWLVYSGLLAFLLGTYDVVDLKRNQRGRVVLTKTWRVCFVFLKPVTVRLSEYEGVAAGLDRNADMWDWLVLLALLGLGCIPGFLWWYLAIYSQKYYVALSQYHGAPEYYLYRGLSQKHMEEMERTIRDVAFPS